MAAGKNTVAAMLEARGFEAIDADSVARSALEKLSARVKEEFEGAARAKGVMIASGDGAIDRRALGKILFADRRLLARHEAILLPEIGRAIGEFVASRENAAVNAVSLFKIPSVMRKCSLTLFVEAPFFERLRRAMARDGLPARQVAARFRAQRGLRREYEKTGVPIATVRNSRALEALEREVDAALAAARMAGG